MIETLPTNLPRVIYVSRKATEKIIAARHYLKVTDTDFDRSVERDAKSGATEAQNLV